MKLSLYVFQSTNTFLPAWRRRDAELLLLLLLVLFFADVNLKGVVHFTCCCCCCHSFVRLLLLAERDWDEEKYEEQVKEDKCDAEEVNDSWRQQRWMRSSKSEKQQQQQRHQQLFPSHPVPKGSGGSCLGGRKGVNTKCWCCCCAGIAEAAEATTRESVESVHPAAARASERPHCILQSKVLNWTQLLGVPAAISECILHAYTLSHYPLLLLRAPQQRYRSNDDTSSWAFYALTRIGMHMHAPARASNHQHRPFIN